MIFAAQITKNGKLFYNIFQNGLSKALTSLILFDTMLNCVSMVVCGKCLHFPGECRAVLYVRNYAEPRGTKRLSRR